MSSVPGPKTIVRISVYNRPTISYYHFYPEQLVMLVLLAANKQKKIPYRPRSVARELMPYRPLSRQG